MLNVSECFGPTVQGEGFSAGVPAVFVRLAGCNLMCGGHNSELVKQGKATWWCDSERLWRDSTKYTNEQLEQKIIELGELPFILTGKTHLVWTGGEPTIPENADSIIDFLLYMGNKYPGTSIYNELETNGSISSNLFTYAQQINCSPKLSNSGMPKDKRINTEAIFRICDIDRWKGFNGKRYWFKFVISKEEDIHEIQRDFITPFNIPSDRIILMPGVDNLNDLSERTRFACEMSKKYHYRMCTRIQTLCWDRKTGV